MRVGLDGRMLYHSGIGRYIQNVLCTLPSPDLRMVVWLNERGMKDPRIDSPFIEKRFARSPVFSPLEQGEITAGACREKLDLFHSPHVNVPLLYPGKLVVTVHDLIPMLFPGTIFPLGEAYFTRMVRWSTHKARRILTVSENTRADLIRYGVGAERIDAVPNGVDRLYAEAIPLQERSAALKRYGISAPYLLYAGQWKRYKNVHGLLQAFAALKETKNVPDLKLVLVGRIDPKAGILEEVEQLGLKGEVIPTGYVVEEREIVAIYQEATAFVFPSLYEGFGLPPLEAMMAGVPVISSNRSAMPEVVGDAALLIDPEDPDEMREAIERVLLDPPLREELIERGRRRVERFSWDATAQGVRRAYEMALR